MDNQQQMFLSHSGLDYELASSLSRRIEHELNVPVFNTSEPEDRFKDLKEILQAEMLWEPQVERYDTELKDYLRKNLLNSKGYILLVTERSLHANSSWIEFEMALASEEARQRGIFFIPCVAQEALFRRLPRIASEFQGVEIESEGGFRKLLKFISQALEKT